MNKTALSLATVTLVPLLQAVTPLAHHSIAEFYDTTKTIALTGTVVGTGGAPDGPHRFIFLEVRSATSAAEMWAVEAESQNTVIAAGMRICPCPPDVGGVSTVRLQNQITVSVYLAKPGASLEKSLPPFPGGIPDLMSAGRLVHLASITTADGKTFSFGVK